MINSFFAGSWWISCQGVLIVTQRNFTHSFTLWMWICSLRRTDSFLYFSYVGINNSQNIFVPGTNILFHLAAAIWWVTLILRLAEGCDGFSSVRLLCTILISLVGFGLTRYFVWIFCSNWWIATTLHAIDNLWSIEEPHLLDVLRVILFRLLNTFSSDWFR